MLHEQPTIRRVAKYLWPALLAWVLLGCTPPASESMDDNPFLEDHGNRGKADTGWITAVNAPEVELMLEGEIEVPGKWQFMQGPTDQSQFALTYLRKHARVYIESQFVVPEHKRRVEWLVDGKWVAADQVNSADVTTLSRYRISGVNAIVYKPDDPAALVGRVYDATVPLYPYFIVAKHGGTCATNTSHGLWDEDYWYFWDPKRSECKMDKSTMKATVTKKIDPVGARYPEYDRLLADNKITTIAFFGAMDSSSDPMEDDAGYKGMLSFTRKLEKAGYSKGTSPAGLIRYTRTDDGVELIVDVSTPKDFYGLDDAAHAAVFEEGVRTHEVVIYNGHSIMGTSNLWKNKGIYSSGYQIFFFNGCLGYEYYVGAILDGKGSWEETDVISNVRETPSAPQPKVIAAFLAALFQGASTGGSVNYAGVLKAINKYTYNSIYGVAGARTNCFSPQGSVCVSTRTYKNDAVSPIPDADNAGLKSTIVVPDQLEVGALSCSVAITHPWLGDLTVRLEHDGLSTKLWESSGNSGADLKETFTVDLFKGHDAAGTWTLQVIDSLGQGEGTLDSWSLSITKAKQ